MEVTVAQPNPNLREHDAGRSVIRQRNRPHLSCICCRERRVKCDRGRPCESCFKYGTADSCTYAGRPGRRRFVRQHSSGVCGEGSSHLQIKPTTSHPSREIESNERIIPLHSFSTFVDRLQEYTREDESGSALVQPPVYAPEVLAAFKLAQVHLPTIARTELLLTFFREQLDWMYVVGDFDSMQHWLLPFMKRIKASNLHIESLEKSDATRLALVAAYVLASIQIASESLVKVYFLDSEVSSSVRKQGLSLTSKSITNSYEDLIRTLLDIATQYDGTSTDLIRASMVYLFFLKNEGQHGEEKAVPLMQKISKMVRAINLHLDPPTSLSKQEKESRRRLFWTFYIYDRITSASFGTTISIREDEITTHEVDEDYFTDIMGRKSNICQKYKARLSKFLEGFLDKVRSGQFGSTDVRECDAYLRDWAKSLPAPLHLDLPQLDPPFRHLRNFELERHLLHISFYASRAALHRICFFPSDTISLDQVQHSRQICAETALSMIKIQESLRMIIVSDHHLRCLYVPLFTLESSVTLAMLSLVELATTPSGSQVPSSTQLYMQWACRGRDLLLSIPPDFTPAVQAVKTVSRILSKAAKIIELRGHASPSENNSTNAIRDVFIEENGTKLSIPLLEQSYGRTGIQLRPAKDGVSSQSVKQPTNTTTPSTCDNSTNELPSLSLHGTDDTYPNTTLDSGSDDIVIDFTDVVDFEPTFADIGLQFFDNLGGDLQLDNLSASFPNYPPDTNNQSLDDQMNLWLASLQKCG